ncbi:MAG TPA: hypothetical protein VGW35_01130 [Methylomirabilota bacterium]|nr:hypothetical protein [Methylomirabilota bacterium]
MGSTAPLVVVGSERRVGRRHPPWRRSYAARLTAYSAGLKHLVIVDALMIGAGFVLRALAEVVVNLAH